MKREEILKLIKEVGACESIEDVRAKLVDLEKGVDTDYLEHEKILSERDTLKERNEKLTKANMDLYLLVNTGSGKEDSKEPQGGKQENEPEELTYDNLFNDEGGLK